MLSSALIFPKEEFANIHCLHLIWRKPLLLIAVPKFHQQLVADVFHLFKGFKSTQMRTVPFFFGTATIPAHQGVGSSTLEMTPNSSILFNSSVTLGRNGKGIFLGVDNAYGIASGSSCMS